MNIGKVEREHAFGAAFSTDGKVWHKAADALVPACAKRGVPNPTPDLHNCSALYTDAVELDDGTTMMLSGRERPAVRC